MAAVVASRPPGAQTKMKKPSMPLVQTNMNGVKPSQPPSSSPSSATKRLPGQPQSATPLTATPASANPNAPRPNRRLQRLSTKGGPLDGSIDKKTAKRYPEPFVPNEKHMLKKFKGKPPSLIVHFHPTHFRFDQQDGSFSYHSEMKIFIEHLKNGTIPHDMVEEFRNGGVQFYDGWLIVRVVDHRTVTQSTNSSNSSGDDGKPFSIHNYNPYITPSPYAPYPTKEQTGQRSPQLKQEQRDPGNRDGPSSDARSEDTVAAPTRSGRPEPKTYHVGLRPTILSSHMDLVMDAMAPDPKSRKQSQANTGRGAGGAPPTPVSGVPATPAVEKGPPLKKLKLKIDAKDLSEYEARIVNATAPPLYLEPAESLEDAEAIIAMLRDAHHDAPPPSSRSRKRTYAELAADDAHAKQQERFMLIMDERNASNATGANAGAVEAQAGVGLFQPRFEKFNALENIKRDITERKQREKDRQLQEDETRRGAQERLAEEDRCRMAVIQRQREVQHQKARQEQEMRAQAHQAAQAQQAQNMRMQHQQSQQQQQQQASSIPPQMQNQMMASQARVSPQVRHGTPHATSSPIVNNQQGGQAMSMSGSQQGAGSPQRPGSAVQHGHPGVAMARGPSAQGPSRHGTPQIPHSTPGMRTATPAMRGGTPVQHMTQASPHGSMMVPTPQMAHSMQIQAQQGMPPQQQQQYTAQQVQQIQQARQQAMQQQAARQQMVNGTPQMQPAQVAEMHAQQQRQAAMQRMQQAQQAQAMQQQAHPQTPQMVAQSPAQGTAQYKQQLAEQMKAQMQQASNQGSPAPNQMTPQQQHAAQLAHQQQQQQRMMQQNQQQNPMMANMNPQMQQQQQRINPQQMPPQMQQFYQNAMQTYQQKYMAEMAKKYGGNTGMLNQQDLAQVNSMAQQAAMSEVQKRRAQAAAQAQAKAQQAGLNMQAQQAAVMRQQAQQQGGQMPNGTMGMQQGHPNAGGQAGNMNAMLQQQQAHHMQQMQMAQAAQQMQHLQHAQHQSPQQQGGMASIQAYQQQLQQMQQQQQQQQRQG